MYIASAQIENIFKLHLHKVNLAADIRPISSALGADSLSLSGPATEIRGIKQHMSSLPDIRSDKVNDIRSSIASGSYGMSDFDIASAMLGKVGAVGGA